MSHLVVPRQLFRAGSSSDSDNIFVMLGDSFGGMSFLGLFDFRFVPLSVIHHYFPTRASFATALFPKIMMSLKKAWCIPGTMSRNQNMGQVQVPVDKDEIACSVWPGDFLVGGEAKMESCLLAMRSRDSCFFWRYY